VIPFADGHTRQLPKLIAGPFKYEQYAADYLIEAKKYTSLPVKQAVISASAISFIISCRGNSRLFATAVYRRPARSG
jgi:5-methyltetrahydropteroyltriglutamate--homocysteine methyltransferase